MVGLFILFCLRNKILVLLAENKAFEWIVVMGITVLFAAMTEIDHQAHDPVIAKRDFVFYREVV